MPVGMPVVSVYLYCHVPPARRKLIVEHMRSRKMKKSQTSQNIGTPIYFNSEPLNPEVIRLEA